MARNAPREIGGNSERFIGMIDSLRVYNVKRSASEICEAAGFKC